MSIGLSSGCCSCSVVRYRDRINDTGRTPSGNSNGPKGPSGTTPCLKVIVLPSGMAPGGIEIAYPSSGETYCFPLLSAISSFSLTKERSGVSDLGTACKNRNKYQSLHMHCTCTPFQTSTLPLLLPTASA